jgi:predicted nucleic acid-binding protein
VGTVALDASVIIGFLDPDDEQHDAAVELLASWLSPDHPIIISASVYAEILVHPIRLGTDHQMETFLGEGGIQVVPIDRSLARQAASLRAVYQSLKLPDAFALATAIRHQADFVTLDARLRRIFEELQER